MGDAVPPLPPLRGGAQNRAPPRCGWGLCLVVAVAGSTGEGAGGAAWQGGCRLLNVVKSMKAVFTCGYRQSPRQNQLSAHAGYGSLLTCDDVQASAPEDLCARHKRCGASGKEQIRGFGT